MSGVEMVAALHRPVQWKGWRLWAARIGHEPLAFVDSWCRECRKPWPCPTADALSTPTPRQEPGGGGDERG